MSATQDDEDPPTPYAGLATRAVAFVIDAALIDLVAIIVAVGASLVLALFRVPHDLRTILIVLGAVLYVLWAVGYFVAFWTGTGQTPGARVMQIRLVPAGRREIRPTRAVLRFVGLVLAALPLFAGFVPVLFDGKRRAFQDYLARTLVVHAPQQSLAAARRDQAPRGVS